MEKAFLRQVAQLFVNDNLDDYTFVFPNRRSSLFFLKHLGELKKKPLFAPKVFTIDNLFDYLSDLERADDIILTFRLWKEYRTIQEKLLKEAGQKEDDIVLEDVDSFFQWGKIILSDFNDVDQYMVDASKVFKNVEDYSQLRADPSAYLEKSQIDALRRIGDFSSGLFDKEKAQRKYLEIWNMLLPLYRAFKESLEKDSIAFPGMLARSVAEGVCNCSSNPSLSEKLARIGKAVFIGFSAPTECEKVLMRYFKKEGGLFYWDFYSDWIKAPHNRSSHLISKCVDEFPSTRPIAGNGGWDKDQCSFNLIPASGATEQALIVNWLLNKMAIEGADTIDTAVVVSDEQLLLPLLEVLSQKDFNITMGYPLKATSTASFVFTLFNLHTRSQKSENEILFPGEVFISLLGHPFIKELDIDSANIAIDHIRNSNLYLISTSEFEAEKPFGLDKDDTIVKVLHKMIPSSGMYKECGSDSISAEILEYQRNIFEYLVGCGHISLMEKTFLKVYLGILDRISASKVGFDDPRTVYSIIRSSIKTALVPFKGEPLGGIQIMGALETRVLDFKRVIFLSFNDGTYPASGEISSCIPYFLRKGYGLPTYEDDNSISAYNFYRLIQRADDVYMIYDTANTDSLHSKEESRFVKQLKYDFGVKFKLLDFKFPLPAEGSSFTNDIEVGTADCEQLGRFFSDFCEEGQTPKYFSASSLNTYLECQRKFFFQKALGLKEDDDLSDEVGAAGFGSIYHNCMQHIYDEFKGLTLSPETMEKILSDIKNEKYLDCLVSNAFKDELKVGRIDGQNLLIGQLVKTYIRQTIAADISKAKASKYTLLGNEYEINKNLGEEFGNSFFTGKLDRLEVCSDVPRICDYKTGVFLDVDTVLGRYLESNNFTVSEGDHYLPFKELEEGAGKFGNKKVDDLFEVQLQRMFGATATRKKYDSILFQMFVYALLYRAEGHSSAYFDLSIYQLRILDKCGPVTIRISNSQLDKFAQRLKDLLEEIKSVAAAPGTKIKVCKDDKNCNYCEFNKYCRRVKDDN